MERFTPEELKRAKEIANSKDGQMLLNRLQQEKGDQIQSAINSGDKEKLKSVLKEFLSNPEVQQMRKKLGDKNNG